MRAIIISAKDVIALGLFLVTDAVVPEKSQYG